MNGAEPVSILFDLDGTLVDSLPGIEFSVREAFGACRLPLPKNNLREMIGPPIRTILSRAGNITDENQLDALERAFRVSYDSEGWRKTVSFPGAYVVLKKLHEQGNRLFVVSNKPRHISLRILERERILEYFEAVVTRDSRSPGYRSKEEMVEVLLAEREIAIEDCILVGDTAEDANAAATAGIKFIWMTHGYGVIQSSVSTLTLDNFSQLFPLIAEGALL
jgi:phosphoglycolate phosphatase